MQSMVEDIDKTPASGNNAGIMVTQLYVSSDFRHIPTASHDKYTVVHYQILFSLKYFIRVSFYYNSRKQSIINFIL
jgi:hypothetical protein